MSPSALAALLFVLSAGSARAQLLPSLDAELSGFKASPCSAPPRRDDSARGSYFRKVESLPSIWARGISGTGTLPWVALDNGRSYETRPGAPEHWAGPLDRPSVYLGAHSDDAAVDAGLVWDRVYDAAGRPTARFAFRPYWRTTAADGTHWKNPPRGSPEYFEPGERFTMTLQLRADDEFRLDIRSESAPHKHLTAFFHRGGFALAAPRRFKRVNAIDQFRIEDGRRVGNESRPAIPTRSRAVGGDWWQTRLLSPSGADAALAGAFCRPVLGPDDAGAVLVRAVNARGGERVDLSPAR